MTQNNTIRTFSMNNILVTEENPSELINFIIDMKTYLTTLNSSVLTNSNNTTITLLPNINYYSNPNIDLTLDDHVTLNFDASGDSNAQFFINIENNLDLKNVDMELMNGAQSNNIFWLINGEVSIQQVHKMYGYFLPEINQLLLKK